MSKIVADNISPRGSDVTIAGVGTFSSSGVNLTGVVTATSFVGNVTGNVTGGSLTGISTIGVTTITATNANITQLTGVGAGTSIQIPSGSAIVGLDPGSIVAPGMIVQTVANTTTSELSTSDSSYQDWFSVTMTPRYSNSDKIITVYAIRNVLTSGGFEANYRISDGTNTTDRWRLYNGDAANTYKSNNMSWYWEQSHTAGVAVTFTAQARDGNASGTVIWGDFGSTSYLVVQEIYRDS